MKHSGKLNKQICLLYFCFAFLIFILLPSHQLLAQNNTRPFELDLNLGAGLIGNPEINTTFQPEIGFNFMPGKFGFGLRTGLLSFENNFEADQYRSGFEDFTSVSGSGNRWRSFFLGIGPRFEFGSRLPVTFRSSLDLALSYNSPPSVSVDFNDPNAPPGGPELQLSDISPGDDYNKWSAALRPEISMQFNPGGSDRFSIQLSTGVMHRLSENEFTYSQKDLSEVRLLPNAEEMFAQFNNAPEVQRSAKPPKTNFFATIGLKISFGGNKSSASSGLTGNETIPDPIEPENQEEEEEEQEAPEQLFVGLNGEFEVENLNISGTGTFSGNGEVFIDWLQSYVAVEFTNITVNPNNDHLLTGNVTSVIDANAPAYPKAWASPLANNVVAYNHPDIAVVHNFMLQQPFYEYNGTPINQTVLEAPIGVELDPDSWFAITEMVFQSDKSMVNSVIAYQTPADWNNADLVGFAIKDLEFHPTSLDFQQGRLEIVDDLMVGNANNDIAFSFIAPDGNNVGTFIEWDQNGFSLFGIEIMAEFTRDWMLPVPDNGTDKVAATLSGTGYAWNDLLLSGDLDKGEFVDGAGMTIEANALTYDMSDSLNPAGIDFPDNYTGQDTTELWRGFHAKNLTVGLPESMETSSGGPPEVGVQDMIIDHQGVTLMAFANNVYQYPNASVADLNASVDTVTVNIETNTFTEAYITGQVAIPATHPDSIQNPLVYTGLLVTGYNTQNNSTFELTVQPGGPIYTNMLKGTFSLEPSSVITASVGNGQKSFDMELHGGIEWANIDLNPVTNINMGLDFTNLGFGYDSNSGLSFSLGNWSLASPQKFMHNFPVSIQNIQYVPQTAGSGQLLKGKLAFDTIFNLSDDVGGQSSMGIEFAIEDESQNFKKFSPSYEGLVLDSLLVNANMKAVNINGALYIENDDPIFGKRVKGDVQAEFTGVGLNIDAEAQFGNTNYQNGSQLYRYWQVDIQADFPAPGLPFLTGIAFRGFGGGAYNNMEVAVSQTGDRSFTPQKDLFGFNAGATVATSPEEKGFNADVDLMGEFSTTGGGMTYVGFNGDFGTGASIVDRRNGEGKVFGNVLVDYVFPTKIFTLAANANINTVPVKTIPGEPFNLVLNIDGMTNDWSFKAGVPTNTNSVEVLGVSLYEYLMLGNAIPNPNGFTPQFAGNYAQHFGYNPNNAHMQGQIDNNLAELGAGFAMGLGFEFEASGSKEVYSGAFRDWSIAYQAAAGAELHLSFLEYGSCGGYGDWGINGWRASGGFGFYASVSAQAQGFHRNNGVVDKNYNLATLKAGGYLAGKFPKPVYASGAVSGSATVLNVFNVDFHQYFEFGDNCSGSPVQPNVSITPGDAAADFAGALVNYVVPLTGYEFPTESPLSVQFGLVPEEEFSVPETQTNGTIEMRTFRLDRTVTLEKEQNGNWVNEPQSESTNNLGEYQYIIPGPIPGLNTGPVVIAPGTSSPPSGNGQGSGMAQQQNQLWTSNPQTGGGTTIPPYQQAPVLLAPNAGTGGGNTNPNYGNLPPEPPPPVNDLEPDTWYRFTVTAELKENVNGSWVTATDNNGTAITQTVVKNFYTGEMPLVAPSSSLQTIF